MYMGFLCNKRSQVPQGPYREAAPPPPPILPADTRSGPLLCLSPNWLTPKSASNPELLREGGLGASPPVALGKEAADR